MKARTKQADPLLALQEVWGHQRMEVGKRLLATVRAEYGRQRATLPDAVRAIVSDLLGQATGHPAAYLEKTLQAAFYLGILSEVTAGFGDVE